MKKAGPFRNRPFYAEIRQFMAVYLYNPGMKCYICIRIIYLTRIHTGLFYTV